MLNPENIINEAKQLEKSKKILEYFMNELTTERYKKISELYEKAGNIYKINDDKIKALKCFMKSYNYLILLSDSCSFYDYDIKKILIEIAELYSIIDYSKSIEYYEKIINIYVEKGDILNIVKIYQIISNIYFDSGDYEKSYEINLKIIGIIGLSNKFIDIKKKIIEKISQIYNTKESVVNIFEFAKLNFSICDDYLKLNLGYMSPRYYILNGLLMNLVVEDIVKTKINFEKYSEMDNTFLTSREGAFASKLIMAVESFDSDELSFICGDYDKIKPFDNIQINLLLKIKNNIIGMSDVDLNDLNDMNDMNDINDTNNTDEEFENELC